MNHFIFAILCMATFGLATPVYAAEHDHDAHSHHEKTAETATKPATSDETDVKAYSPSVCLVSDEKLGSMGDPIALTHNKQEIKLCCDACIDSFKEKPDEFLDKLAKLEATAKDDKAEPKTTTGADQHRGHHKHGEHDHGKHDH